MSNISPKLRWACRRGMLELDVLLGDFLEGAYNKLNDDEKKCFVALLDSSDQDLFFWLTQKETPSDKNFAEMIRKIREYARNKH